MKKDYAAIKIDVIFMKGADVITASDPTSLTVGEFKWEWLKNGFTQGGEE